MNSFSVLIMRLPGHGKLAGVGSTTQLLNGNSFNQFILSRLLYLPTVEFPT